jgi:hypothetical protein
MQKSLTCRRGCQVRRALLGRQWAACCQSCHQVLLQAAAAAAGSSRRAESVKREVGASEWWEQDKPRSEKHAGKDNMW